MSVTAFLVAFFSIRSLRNTLANENPQLDRFLQTFSFVVIGLLALTVVLPSPIAWIGEALWNLSFLVILGIAYQHRAHRTARQLVTAIAPYVLVEVVSDLLKWVVPSWERSVHNYLELASMGAGIWLIAMVISARNARKAIDREALKRKEEEERSRQIAANNMILEQMVAERTAELTQQKQELEQTLTELRETQAQLVHREKMASLGELTAGIAHEIQNPLNFVNNFSEVSVELVEELREEATAGRTDEVLAIVDDLTQNLQKITHHGKRADSIVRGMLEHSRATTGQKQPTDLNALVDEYLRLSYHGHRAKDKGFNASLVTDFQPDLEKVQLVGQDVGRVFLNLFNNAFYALKQRQREAGAGYQPTLWVRTGRQDGAVFVQIRDNGTGIPEEVVSKIFQPFFTTKPTGEGTGLGLSLSYDIIHKGHGGEMTVDTREGEGTEFLITLPTGRDTRTPGTDK